VLIYNVLKVTFAQVHMEREFNVHLATKITLIESNRIKIPDQKT